MNAVKRRLATAFSRNLWDPIVKLVAGRISSVALLETIGRKTGEPRQTPVGNGLKGDTFWIIAEHGHQAGFVRNILANPRVRVLVDGRWRSGTAHVLPDDDPRARQRELPAFNAAVVRLAATEMLTLRIDLDH